MPRTNTPAQAAADERTRFVKYLRLRLKHTVNSSTATNELRLAIAFVRSMDERAKATKGGR